MEVNCLIVPMPSQGWPSVRAIYGEGIATGNATFETELPDWEKWDKDHRKDCRLLAIEPFGDTDDLLVSIDFNKVRVLGWAALSRVSERRVYSGVAEVSVYVTEAARGRGIGKALLQALVDESEVCGIWMLQAGIFPENVASIALHKSCGFRKVGVRRRIGKINNDWRDVLLFERRSLRIGI